MSQLKCMSGPARPSSSTMTTTGTGTRTGTTSGSSTSPSSLRAIRNAAEKNRRDKINGYISELSTIVPLVAQSKKKLDKTSILRLSAAYLRLEKCALSNYSSLIRSVTNEEEEEDEDEAERVPLDGLALRDSAPRGEDSVDLLLRQPLDASSRSSISSSLHAATSSHPQQKSPPPLAPSVALRRGVGGTSEITKTLFDALDGFILVMTASSKIILVTHSVERFLGHLDIDMIGHDLSSFIHPADHQHVANQLLAAHSHVQHTGGLISERVSVRCRLRERSQARSEVITYQMFQITGHLILSRVPPPSSTSPPATADTTLMLTPPPAAQKERKEMARNEDIEREEVDLATTCHGRGSKRSLDARTGDGDEESQRVKLEEGTNAGKDDGGDEWRADGSEEGVEKMTDESAATKYQYLFKGFAQMIKTSPMAELNLMDADLDEYVTRITLDGTLLFADHRISLILGHSPHEVVGRSAYDYIKLDDHCISLFAHRLMLSNANGTGIIVHRLRSKNGDTVYLQNSGCLQYDRSTGQVDHFVCVSRVLHTDEGDREREKFVQRFTPHIHDSTPAALYESLQIVIGPDKCTRRYIATSAMMGKSVHSLPANSANPSGPLSMIKSNSAIEPSPGLRWAGPPAVAVAAAGLPLVVVGPICANTIEVGSHISPVSLATFQTTQGDGVSEAWSPFNEQATSHNGPNLSPAVPKSLSPRSVELAAQPPAASPAVLVPLEENFHLADSCDLDFNGPLSFDSTPASLNNNHTNLSLNDSGTHQLLLNGSQTAPHANGEDWQNGDNRVWDWRERSQDGLPQDRSSHLFATSGRLQPRMEFTMESVTGDPDSLDPSPGLTYQQTRISYTGGSGGGTVDENEAAAAVMRQEINNLLQEPYFVQHAHSTGRQPYRIPKPSDPFSDDNPTCKKLKTSPPESR